MSFQIESARIGTTNPKSSAWDSIIYEKDIVRLFHTLDIPVYHTETRYNEDMGYDRKGRRAPYIDSIDVYIWTISNESLPIVHLYEIHPKSKYIFLKEIITNPLRIRQLSVEDYDEEDDTFSKVYDAIYSIVSTSN